MIAGMAKSKQQVYDPYADLIARLNGAGVDYVVIGMSGINYYASSARDTFGTQGLDLFLRPALANAVKTYKIFQGLGYEMSADGKAIKEGDLSEVLKRKRTVLAVNPDGIMFECLFAVSGFTYRQLAGDASVFKAGDVLIRVGKLHKLLASKRAAGRPKDKLFLKRYELLLKEIDKK
ncbi:MAG: hypothetical protein BWY42_01617 [Candidatus Omnitrophica bacterium ADurb.Bin277]|nr:MAG: hypothetical protein BWY42_01617 [Candidatus Omnitrophica bacterium ADurb.Bin277]